MTSTKDVARASGLGREFAAVDLLIRSQDVETRGVDAFALSVIKVERQVRRLFTFSIYQLPCFDKTSIPDLTRALAERQIFLHGLMAGFEMLHPVTMGSLVGPESPRLLAVLETARGYRNKIFHGQRTGEGLSREQLLDVVDDLRTWCRLLGSGAQAYMGYDGFSDSFRDAADPAFVSGYRRSITDLAGYEHLLDEMVPKRGPRQ
jgi:hypothetical protein